MEHQYLTYAVAERADSLDSNTRPLLTKRETEILKLITEEYSSIEIADMLCISLKTVDTHRKTIIRKIGARNVVGLVRYALQLRIANWNI
ncbi:DNA-binding CsgD family transcriptional regulator [Pontibacter aydingkolensis]|uniref:LuxR C-terminal-related transcriptional regulator n=1 Tax=Pontibacter aydingkolensis TaxID=1911536 RepID=A0ABS7CSN0_9BACT|nr:LuxR C-terminal-related transcriptional regulator [Pontibacter aydingkolensis]MBW7466838.1 LuxR C-terminal-related transcriptional regulator [Pontibacter aydingkolensis]